MKFGALSLSIGLAGCSGLVSTNDSTPPETTATPVPVPTDESPETQTSTPTQTQTPTTLNLSAKPLTETDLKAAQFWQLDALPSSRHPLAATVIENGIVEQTANSGQSLPPVLFVSTGGRHYRIDREEIAIYLLEYAITYKSVTTCPDVGEDDHERARAEAILFPSLPTADQTIVPPSTFSHLTDGECGSFTFWHAFETHEAASESAYTTAEPFYVEYQGDVSRVSAEPAPYATKHPHYRYSVTEQSDTLGDFELPKSVVSDVDTSQLFPEEQTQLSTLLRDGHLQVEENRDDADSAVHFLLNRIIEAGQQGPEKHYYFEVDSAYYEFDFWYAKYL